MQFKTVSIFEVHFYQGSIQHLIQALEKGGLLMVPSGPGLAELEKDAVYYDSLKNADFVIPDSGLMVLLWNLTHRRKMHRISGYLFLKTFFQMISYQQSQSIFYIMPSKQDLEKNVAWLKSQNLSVSSDQLYIAPRYDRKQVEDAALVTILNQRKPRFIILAVGSGPQEKLGLYLKQRLSYKPAILPIGAAIGFLSGAQVRIPFWADYLYLGWLVRIMSNPRLYLFRYIRALKLIKVYFKFLRPNHSF
jgi:N-acetylglucosaminyldiphosphoundecaprenol N-acetyl-beta-D-mannosaminyltransferase